MTLQNFDQLLKKYADLLIYKGINVTEGDYVNIQTDVNSIELTRLLVAAAYEAGAADVHIQWSDDQIARLNYQNQTIDQLKEVPDYVVAESDYYIEKRAKRLAIRSTDPNNFKGIDADKIAAANKAKSIAMHNMRLATQANVVSWTVAAAAGQAWAQLVFPDKSPEDALDALWDQIFKTTRVYEEDPIKAWDDHEAKLQEKAKYLNDQQFDQLHYTGPGTDFTVGMPKNHVWESAGSHNEAGQIFIANMQTEEVFTAPDSFRAQGYVSASKPLSYGGVVIDGMKFYFEDGKVTKVEASQGQATLEKLVEENDGARSLGEVALVPHKSPISQSNIIFFNTLFDENASNHIALGQAYATSIQDGTKMSQDQLKAAGLNRSTVHVDFMIGNGQMDIDGIKADGSVHPIFRNGEWAF